MPRRDDIRRIMIVGSGPIVIGQACEFDYSGTQACKVLRREGYEVSLVNSNPATIMTDPQFADRDVHRAARSHVGARRARARTSGRAVADPRRSDRPQRRCGAGGVGRSGSARRPVDRREPGGDPSRRGPERVQTDDARGRSGGAAGGRRAFPRPRAHARGRDRLSAHRAAVVHARRGRSGFAHRARSSRTWRGGAWRALLWARSWSRSRSLAGRSSSSRSCAMATTTASSCARSRTSTRWGCTPATRSRWHPCRRSPTRSTNACATRRCAASGRSASRPAVRTCSSPCIPRDGRMVLIEMNPRVSRSSALASKATGFPSRSSPPCWPWATAWMRSRTTSRGRRPRPSSRRSTTWW